MTKSEKWPHLIMEGIEGDHDLLNDVDHIEGFMKGLPLVLDMKVLMGPFVKKVTQEDVPTGEPGVTGVSMMALTVITTSHISIHTWPEWGLACIDVFSCKKFDEDAVEMLFKETFKFGEVVRRIVPRGRAVIELKENQR